MHITTAAIRGLLTSLLILVASSAAGAATFVVANGANTSYGAAQPMNQNPDLVIQQTTPNYTLGTAQNVSPLWYGSDAFGSISNSITQEYFSLSAATGADIQLGATSSIPAVQTPELLLYDPNGNLVAIADGNGNDNSSDIDFTVPAGDGGVWTTEVTSDSFPSDFGFDLRLTGNTINYTTDVLGATTAASQSDFYSVNASAGDPLHFFVQSEDPTSLATELLLYDPNGNLVAIADGNGPDGYSSLIDFNVPGNDTGAWTVEVTDSTSAPGALFPYDLQITGATAPGGVDPVPEPASISVCAAMLLGLGLRRRKN